MFFLRRIYMFAHLRVFLLLDRSNLETQVLLLLSLFISRDPLSRF